MRKRFSFENFVFYRTFSFLIAVLLSTNTLFSQDVGNAAPKTSEIYVLDNSLHIVGDAYVSGNIIHSQKTKSPSKTKKLKQHLSGEKIKDKELQENVEQDAVADNHVMHFATPRESNDRVSNRLHLQRLFYFGADSYSFSKAKIGTTKFIFDFRYLLFKETLTISSDFSSGYRLHQFINEIIARPPPRLV